MKKTMLACGLLALFAANTVQGQDRTSGPLTFVRSDVNSKTVFWIQGRWVPIDDPKHQGNAEVVTVVCLVREYECIDLDSDTLGADGEQAWVQEYKVVNWDNDGISATSRSLDGCTDVTLKIRFEPPTVTAVNSPVLPMSERCRKANDAWDKLTGTKGGTLKDQMEQDMLVPTRGLVSFQDVKAP